MVRKVADTYIFRYQSPAGAAINCLVCFSSKPDNVNASQCFPSTKPYQLPTAQRDIAEDFIHVKRKVVTANRVSSFFLTGSIILSVYTH